MDFEEDDFSLASGYGWTDKYLLVYGGSCVWRPKLCHLTDNTVSRFCLRLPPQYSPPPSIQNIYNHMDVLCGGGVRSVGTGSFVSWDPVVVRLYVL